MIRPASCGVYGQHFVKGKGVGDIHWFTSEKQSPSVDVHVRGLPSGGAPGQSLTVTARLGPVGLPGSVQTGRWG